MGEQMVFMGTHVEKSLKKQNEQWIKMMKFLICDNFPKKFQDKEEFCESVSIPEPSESEVAAGSLEEDSDESDSEEPYSLDSHNDQAIPVDQMMMILLKHFYRGGVFIVGDLNMRLKSSADVNEDLFSRLRCNQPDAIATVIESDLNTDEPLRSVGNFKVDYPYALPPSYDFGNFQLKSLLSDKTVQAHCNNAGIHLLSKWTRNGCDTTVPPRVLSPREQRVLVVPEKFYLTLPTYVMKQGLTSNDGWQNALSDIKSFTRESGSTEWTEVVGQDVFSSHLRKRMGIPDCDPFYTRSNEAGPETGSPEERYDASSDIFQLVHEDTFTGRKVFKIGYLDRMQSMTPEDRLLKIDATLMSLQAGGDHAAMAWAYRTENPSSQGESDVFETDVVKNFAILTRARSEAVVVRPKASPESPLLRSQSSRV